MYSYTIMPPDTDHVDEICEDIKWQYENKVADLALFKISLVPEGDPVIDKAGAFMKKYNIFSDRLSGMGIRCGILVQSSIGHGWPLDELFPFRQYVGLSDGIAETSVCPYDENFRQHFRQVMHTLAEGHPALIMIDDDFRLMMRVGKGCACKEHMREFNRRAGTNMSREELYLHTKGTTDTDKKYTDIFVATQGDSLKGLISEMRKGIDEVDPSIRGALALGGDDCEFAEVNAKIIAGASNPLVVRINNGSYHPNGAHYFTFPLIRAAKQITLLKDKIDYFVAETDTIPYDRYSTGAQYIHSHFTGSILEGASGGMHWITKLDNYESFSGKAYRKIFKEHRGFYEFLEKTVPSLRPFGCRIPLSKNRRYYFRMDNVYGIPEDYCWSTHVLERMGLPLYFSENAGSVVFMTGKIDDRFSDEQLRDILKGTVVLASDSLERINSRGFAEYTGVGCSQWEGENISFEMMEDTHGRCDAQKNAKKLTPQRSASVMSYCCHKGRNDEVKKLFPATVLFKNGLGGTVISFCGVPKTEYHYLEAFSMLCRERKKQFVKILKDAGELYVFYSGDAEVYLRAAFAGENEIFCAFFNLSYDVLEEIELWVGKKVIKAEYVTNDGKRDICEFYKSEDGIIIKKELRPLDPVVLFLTVE